MQTGYVILVKVGMVQYIDEHRCCPIDHVTAEIPENLLFKISSSKSEIY